MNKHKPLISVIVPVYNVRDYVGKCLNSVCRQTYSNLEIIVIDDGSTDGSGAVCDEYAARDLRVKVLHCDNGGLSAARNRGLEMATGELVGFVDSDDWIEPEMYEVLCDRLLETRADVSICSYFIDRDDSSKAKFDTDHSYEYGSHEALYGLLKDKSFKNFAWNKLYVKSLFDGLTFPVGIHYEDIAVMYIIFARASKIFYIEKPLYHYFQRPGSITSSGHKSIENELQLFRVLLERSHFLFVYDRNLWRLSLSKTVHNGIRLVDHALISTYDRVQTQRVISFCQDELSKINTTFLRPDLQIKCFLIIHNLVFYSTIYKGLKLLKLF